MDQVLLSLEKITVLPLQQINHNLGNQTIPNKTDCHSQ